MCICDKENVGNEIIMGSAEGLFFQNATGFLDLALFMSDKWSAELHAWTTVRTREPVSLLMVKKKINYCPMCGRRLSLRDAGREDE